MQYIAFFRCL